MFNKENFKNFITKSKKFKETSEINRIQKNTKEEIFSFQNEKKNLINQMHELLKKADNNEEIYFGDRTKTTEVTYLSNELKIRNNKGKPKFKISNGDIAIAQMWGNNIRLSKQVPKQIKKNFIINETKRLATKLWEKQLSLAIHDSNETDHINSVQKLETSSEFDKEKNYEKIPSGHLAEKMINSFFTKILINNKDLPFSIEQADIFDDALEKIDFYFHIKKDYVRGLNIKSCNDNDTEKDNCINNNNIGIQYTMNTDQKIQQKKIKQINKSKERNKNKVDDIILVTVPLDNIYTALEKWKKQTQQKDFSGPEKFLSLENKEKLFKSMISELPNNLQINPEEYWNKISNQV